MLHNREGTCCLSLPNLLPTILQTGKMFTKLNLNDVSLKDSDITNIVKTYKSSLRELRLCSPDLTGVGFAAIADCAKLLHLTLLMAYAFGDVHLRNIVQNAPDLETLDLRSCILLTDDSLALIPALTRLRRLCLTCCRRMSGDALSVLGTIQTLQHLNLGLRNFGIANLRNMTNLRDLRTLEVSTELSPESFDIICDNFKHLEKLELYHCGRLIDAQGVKLCNLEHLKVLGFRGSVGFTDLTFEKRLGSPELEGLSLEGCSVTDAGLASVADNHSRLRRLRLSQCSEITDDGLASLLRREPLLEELILNYCDSLTDACLGELESLCPRLRELTIYNFPTTAAAVSRFQRQRPCVGVYHPWENPRVAHQIG